MNEGERHTERDTERERHTEGERQRERETETERERCLWDERQGNGNV